MEIQLQIYNVPVTGSEREERMREVNAFIKGRDIKRCTAQVIESGPQPYWTLLIAYSTEAGVPDGGDRRPKEASDLSRYQGDSQDADPNDLDANEKRIFNDLRRWRRGMADKENKPLYLILNNRQLIDIIKSEPPTPQDLMKVKSIPERKARDYGAQIIKILWAER